MMPEKQAPRIFIAGSVFFGSIWKSFDEDFKNIFVFMLHLINLLSGYWFVFYSN